MKKFTGILTCAFFVLVTVGCSWQMPEKISVKTDAEYNFALGNFEKNLDSELNQNAMLGNIGNDNNNIKIYDYFPGKTGKDVQHFLVEAKIIDINLSEHPNLGPAIQTALALVPDGANLSLGDIPGLSTLQLHETIGLDFNPSSIISELSRALGGDMLGKIKFNEINMYVYCEAASGLQSKARLNLFYGDKSNPIVARRYSSGEKANQIIGETILDCYSDPTIPASTASKSYSYIENSPRPSYELDENTVTADLSKSPSTVKLSIANLINSQLSANAEIQSTDQLCMEYNVSGISGAISKADAQNGIKISLYALIDLPLSFDILDDLKMDLNKMSEITGSDTSVDTSNVDTSGTNEFSKYLDIIESLTVRYAAYKLPVHSTSGINIGIDMAGKGHFVYQSLSLVKEDSDEKSEIIMDAATIQKIKEISTVSPNIQIWLRKDSRFSIPREKAVKVNLELSLKTNGTVQIQ